MGGEDSVQNYVSINGEKIMSAAATTRGGGVGR
jgi:hypothetical protein